MARGGLAQILLFIIATPYTWFGGGGSVGNRYFIGAYGLVLFLFPRPPCLAGNASLGGRRSLHGKAGAQPVRGVEPAWRVRRQRAAPAASS